MKQNYPFCINVDWLQFYCTNDSGHEFGSLCRAYKIKLLDHGSKVFKKLYNIIDANNVVVATAAVEPYSSVIKPTTVILKLSNEVLYLGNLWEFSLNLIKLLNLTYHGITRIDIAYDCNRLFQGVKPSTLIKGYVQGKWIKKGCQRNWILNAHQNYTLNKASQISSDEITHTYDGITWGGRKSSVHCQIYNKSKELKEVHDKPWIRREWKRAGLNEKDVWRFEIRITNDGKDLVSMEEGDFFKLGVDFIQDQQTVNSLFLAYSERYFNFAKCRKISKVSRLTSAKLFCVNALPLVKCMHPGHNLEDTRYLRGVNNKLEQVANEIECEKFKSINPYAVETLREASCIFRELISEKRRETYRKNISPKHGENLYLERERRLKQKEELEERRKEEANNQVECAKIIKQENIFGSYCIDWAECDKPF